MHPSSCCCCIHFYKEPSPHRTESLHLTEQVITQRNVSVEEPKQNPIWRLSFQKYESSTRIINFGSNLAANSTFVTWTMIGSTQQGQLPIHLATIRNPAKKQTRAIFVDAFMTPNHYQTASIACYIMDQLIFNSSHYMDILDTVTFYIVPILNLDSFNYNYQSVTGPDQTPGKRAVEMLEFELMKNGWTGTRPPSCTGVPCQPGVNIATNFPFKWDALPAKVIREFPGHMN